MRVRSERKRSHSAGIQLCEAVQCLDGRHCVMVNRCCGISAELPVERQLCPSVGVGARHTVWHGAWDGVAGVEDSEGESQGPLRRKAGTSPPHPPRPPHVWRGRTLAQSAPLVGNTGDRCRAGGCVTVAVPQ
ncbi:hypothetical protein AAFF_G00051850 [Aldrovandia affinis]|uniref:Uncharacterized protein n=1 Tax=Aldrovandia affinis TaxID=143900 RepID=A0AAD7WZ38_9TELE|nr:hypothetical protein AAFF_G00051850 [Aldrovandia affinis]